MSNIHLFKVIKRLELRHSKHFFFINVLCLYQTMYLELGEAESFKPWRTFRTKLCVTFQEYIVLPHFLVFMGISDGSSATEDIKLILCVSGIDLFNLMTITLLNKLDYERCRHNLCSDFIDILTKLDIVEYFVRKDVISITLFESNLKEYYDCIKLWKTTF